MGLLVRTRIEPTWICLAVLLYMYTKHKLIPLNHANLVLLELGGWSWSVAFLLVCLYLPQVCWERERGGGRGRKSTAPRQRPAKLLEATCNMVWFSTAQWISPIFIDTFLRKKSQNQRNTWDYNKYANIDLGVFVTSIVLERAVRPQVFSRSVCEFLHALPSFSPIRWVPSGGVVELSHTLGEMARGALPSSWIIIHQIRNTGKCLLLLWESSNFGGVHNLLDISQTAGLSFSLQERND